MHTAAAAACVLLLCLLAEGWGTTTGTLKIQKKGSSKRRYIASCCGNVKCSKQTFFNSTKSISSLATTKKNQSKITSASLTKKKEVTKSTILSTTKVKALPVTTTFKQQTATTDGQKEATSPSAKATVPLQDTTTLIVTEKNNQVSTNTWSQAASIVDDETSTKSSETTTTTVQLTTFTNPITTTTTLVTHSLAQTPQTQTILASTFSAATSSSTSKNAAAAMPIQQVNKTSMCKEEPCLTFKNATDTFVAANVINPAIGTYLLIAGKMIYLDSTLTTFFKSVQTCLKLKMRLLTPLLASKVAPMVTAITGKLQKDMEFWTSGANEGNHCQLDQAHTWCALGTRFQRTDASVQWTNASTHPSATEHCVALQTKVDGNFGLAYSQCNDKQSVLCEPLCESASCPSTCSVDESLFDADKILKNADSMGFWAKNVCGSSYFFGNILGTWEQNLQKCCSMGLEPIVFEKTSELECLSNFTKSGWKYNFNYWTGGTQRSCKGQWSWCAGAVSVTFPDNLPWASNQPDNRAGADDCVHMRLLQNATGIVLADKNCSDKYVVACEGLPKLEKCLKPDCQNINKEKDSSLFADGYLQDFFSYGRWLSACGTIFLFSKEEKTWAGAMRVCRSIGTELLAVEYDDKDACIAKLAKKHRAVHGLDYWTSGSQKDCPGKLSWCSLERPVRSRKLSWSNNPDGDCVSVKYGANATSTFTKTNCEKQLLFICEVHNKGTFAQALQAECMDVWSVSIVDMLLFEQQNYNVLTMPKNLKCFIKCIGENLDYFSFGGMPPSANILRLIEDICGEDEAKMQQSFGDYDACSGIRREDECETASEVYQCGRDANLPIIDQIYTAEKGNSTVYSPPVPCIASAWRSCKMIDLPCVKNQTRLDILTQTNKTGKGILVTTAKGVKYFASNKFGNMGWIDARNYCCSLGMYLATFADRTAIIEYNAVRPKTTATYAYVDETYANGEGMDSWCSTHQAIPKLTFNGYTEPQCNTVSCFHADVTVYQLYISGSSAQTCQRNFTGALPYQFHFICV